MCSQALAAKTALSPFEQLRYGREIIQIEADTLHQVASRLDAEFCQAVDRLFHCRGSVIVAGIGKAGIIGQKIAATLASTGTRSHFLHPAEAMHGDLGRVHHDDVMLLLSQSGETEEITRLLPWLHKIPVAILAVTGRRTNTLGRSANVVLELGPVKEACALGLAPSTSTTAMLAIGDALALVTSRMRDFRREDFARFHPGGSLGQQLSHVEDYMRPLEECRVAADSQTIRQVYIELSRPGRRSGAIMLVDASERLTGIFTDSDLARLFENRRDHVFDRAIREVMTASPRTVELGSRMTDAVAIMAERKISELPVVDGGGLPAGLIDITDIVGMIPEESR